MGCTKAELRGSFTHLPQETRNTSNKQPNLISNATGERRTNKTLSQQKESRRLEQKRIK